MRAIVIEDEAPAARRLQRMLDRLGVEVEASIPSVHESVAYFKKHQAPDLIFLDIQLSDGLSFEIFEQVAISSAVIFTTAYDEYALQAFKLNSIDYLLKPIDEEELAQAVDKYKQFQPGEKSLQVDFEDIKNLLVNPVDRVYKKRFVAKVGQHLKLIPVTDIECVYSENKGTYAYTTEGRNYLLDRTLDQLEDELDPEKFFRVSRKFVIHIDAVSDIVSYTNSRLQIRLNRFKEAEVIVSRERVKDFKDWLS
ncbi:response regulator transcription factor [Robertkochia marina]|uniref:Response regulator transcription factor n=1 Tax=Robertkochia marina TaxID=1227945 RepID=A0A4S3LXK8_9FLAO|nr:LytTR family DNA-binding domain-containing protein [Robertkochia marina]THD65802.1 response regulator transcription factor [Robertkochia marina]TRZ46512.1 DNA-binding response regulator [Robertkochia marina]